MTPTPLQSMTLSVLELAQDLMLGGRDQAEVDRRVYRFIETRLPAAIPAALGPLVDLYAPHQLTLAPFLGDPGEPDLGVPPGPGGEAVSGPLRSAQFAAQLRRGLRAYLRDRYAALCADTLSGTFDVTVSVGPEDVAVEAIEFVHPGQPPLSSLSTPPNP